MNISLAVDDDPLILMDVCDILHDAGFQCHDANDAAQAISILETIAEETTLLFTDVEMPGEMNGFDLARTVSERWPNIEIVIASGRVKPKDGELPPKSTFIPKPFSASAIHDHLKEKLPDEKKPEPLKT